MDTLANAPAPAAPAVDKYLIELADERAALRETANVLWKSAVLRPRETGLWSSYGAAADDESAVARIEDAYHLPAYGAVIDVKGRLFANSLAEPAAHGLNLEGLPGFRNKRGRLMFTAARDVPRLERASVFCGWPGQFNYAHFLLESMTALAALDDVGALERYRPVTPPLDAWRRRLVELYLGDRAGLLRQVEAPIVRVGEAVFCTAMSGRTAAPLAALTLLRERLLERAAAEGRIKAFRRIYFASTGQRRNAAHKRLFTDLRELGFTIVDPTTLSPLEQIRLVARAHVIVGPTGAAMANVLFALRGAQVIEVQSGPPAPGWLSTLCDQLGLRWSGFACPPPNDVAPLDAMHGVRIPEETLSVAELAAAIDHWAEA